MKEVAVLHRFRRILMVLAMPTLCLAQGGCARHCPAISVTAPRSTPAPAAASARALRFENVAPSVRQAGALRYTRSLCSEGPDGVTSFAPLQGLVPAAPVPDYLLLLRAEYNIEGLQVGALDQAGWKCAHTRDARACLSVLERPDPLVTGKSAFQPFAIVVQRGDELRAIDTWPELAVLLGPVDTLEEAYLHALLRGFSAECGQSSGQRAGEDWVLAVSRFTPCGKGTYALRVKQDGSIIVLEAREKNWNAGCVRYDPPKGPNSWLEPDGPRP